jgi:hypothetical protein
LSSSKLKISPTTETPSGEYLIEFMAKEKELATSYNVGNPLSSSKTVKVTIV